MGPEAPESYTALAAVDAVKEERDAQGRVVLSAVRLRLAESARHPLLTYRRLHQHGSDYVVGVPGMRLEPGGNLSLVRRSRDRRTEFVFLESYESSIPGGVLFLPGRCDDSVRVITWNVGKGAPDLDPRTNRSHAERQFTEWFDKQGEDWRARVTEIEITNRSTAKGWKGPSPCKECCHLLRGFLMEIKALAKRRRVPKPSATITWLEPYVAKNPKNSLLLDLTRDCLLGSDGMRAPGWTFGGSPMPKR
jgi:hypothetical protein